MNSEKFQCSLDLKAHWICLIILHQNKFQKYLLTKSCAPEIIIFNLCVTILPDLIKTGANILEVYPKWDSKLVYIILIEQTNLSEVCCCLLITSVKNKLKPWKHQNYESFAFLCVKFYKFINEHIMGDTKRRI